MDQLQDLEQTKFVFMLSGQVYFHPDGQEGDVQSVHMNAVTLLDQFKVTAPELGKAQAQMGQQLRTRTGNQPITIVDVVFNSVSFMGEMTPAEWMGTTPEAQKKAIEEAMQTMGQVQEELKKNV